MRERHAVEAFSTTTKMAAADVEQSVDSANEKVLNKMDGLFSLKEEQTT
jgi:BMFP domain-containing protein YqiC